MPDQVKGLGWFLSFPCDFWLLVSPWHAWRRNQWSCFHGRAQVPSRTPFRRLATEAIGTMEPAFPSLKCFHMALDFLKLETFFLLFCWNHSQSTKNALESVTDSVLWKTVFWFRIVIPLAISSSRILPIILLYEWANVTKSPTAWLLPKFGVIRGDASWHKNRARDSTP